MHIGTVYKTNSKGERKAYYRLEESYGDGLGRPRTRRLCVLGYLEELPTVKRRLLLKDCIEALAYEKMIQNGRLAEVKQYMKEYREELVRKGVESVNLSTMKNLDPRETGANHVCVETLKRLRIDRFLSSKGRKPADVSPTMVQIASRAIYPLSELKTKEYMDDNSALCELPGINTRNFTHRHLYRSTRRLYEIYTELEDYLHNRVCTLFVIRDEILLFDLTNIYFEGRMQGSGKALPIFMPRSVTSSCFTGSPL